MPEDLPSGGGGLPGLEPPVGSVDATLKATPGVVYWVTIMGNDDTHYAYIKLMDGGPGGEERWRGGVFDGIGRTMHASFEPVISFDTDIYLDVTTEGGGTAPTVTVGVK